MKKFKIVAVALLALVLAVLCVTGSTFSWFSRPKTLEGKQLDFSGGYSSSVNEGVTFATYESTDGVNYSTQEVTSFSETSGVASGARKYYRTDIYNTGSNAQSVSLYLRSITLNANGDAFALGVNNPSKAYKSISDGYKYTMAHRGKIRVYFQPKTYWTENNFVVNYGGDNDYIDMTWISGDTDSGNRVYYADIPSTASKVFFAVQGWSNAYQRTAAYSLSSIGVSQTQSAVFWLNSGNDGSGYMNSGYSTEITGYNFKNYYNSIEISIDTTFSAALKKGVDYEGGSIEYYSGKESIFTVDKTTGLITPVAVGTAKLYSKLINSTYGEENLQVETTVTITSVTNTSVNDFPIVTNVKALPSVLDYDGETYLPSVSVYWYIKNDSGTDGMKYTIPELYLTL